LKRDLYQKTGAICRVERRKSTKNNDIVYQRLLFRQGIINLRSYLLVIHPDQKYETW